MASELFKRTAEKGGATSYCQSNPKHRVKGKGQGRGERVIPGKGAKGKQKNCQFKSVMAVSGLLGERENAKQRGAFSPTEFSIQ